MDTALLGGVVHCRELDDWQIRWEADDDYRHWCSLIRPKNFNGKFIAVCLFNPGSLKGDGTKLLADTTLRILREVFESTAYGCLVVNLFDRATPKPPQLFSVWTQRDKPNSGLIYPLLSNMVVASIRAYGDYENHNDCQKGHDIKARIAVLEKWRSGFKSIENPENLRKTPMHVMRWQTQSQKRTMAQRLLEFSLAGWE